jgi:hypothetical protein
LWRGACGVCGVCGVVFARIGLCRTSFSFVVFFVCEVLSPTAMQTITTKHGCKRKNDSVDDRATKRQSILRDDAAQDDAACHETEDANLDTSVLPHSRSPAEWRKWFDTFVKFSTSTRTADAYFHHACALAANQWSAIICQSFCDIETKDLLSCMTKCRVVGHPAILEYVCQRLYDDGTWTRQHFSRILAHEWKSLPITEYVYFLFVPSGLSCAA